MRWCRGNMGGARSVRGSLVWSLGKKVPNGWDTCWDDIEAVVCYLPSAIVLLVRGACLLVMEKSCRWFNFSAISFVPMVVDDFMLLFSVYGLKVTVAS